MKKPTYFLIFLSSSWYKKRVRNGKKKNNNTVHMNSKPVEWEQADWKLHVSN